MKALLRVGRVAQGIVEVPSLEMGKVKYQLQYPDDAIDLKKVIQLGNGHHVVVPNYLSPSSISKFYDDPDEAFNTYSSICPPDRFPQTFQMMFGSAFDGAIKSHLVKRLYGTSKEIPKEYDYETIIKDQCEEHFWNKAHPLYNPEHDAFHWAAYLFEAYKTSGAYNDLLIECLEASEMPQFEFTVSKEIKVAEKNGVVLLGKPDCYFKTKQGNQVIYDFKCNGIYSKSSTSPKKQFMRCRDGWLNSPRQGYNGIIESHSRSHGTRHKDVFPMLHKGITINGTSSFEKIDPTWAAQLCTYGWLMDEPVGSDFVLGIDQIVGGPSGKYMQPKIRIASHRAIVSPEWQHEFYNKAQALWDKLQVGHVFPKLSKAESDNKVAEMYAIYGVHEKGSKEEWLANSMRSPKYGHNK